MAPLSASYVIDDQASIELSYFSVAACVVILATILICACCRRKQDSSRQDSAERSTSISDMGEPEADVGASECPPPDQHIDDVHNQHLENGPDQHNDGAHHQLIDKVPDHHHIDDDAGGDSDSSSVIHYSGTDSPRLQGIGSCIDTEQLREMGANTVVIVRVDEMSVLGPTKASEPASNVEPKRAISPMEIVESRGLNTMPSPAMRMIIPIRKTRSLFDVSISHNERELLHLEPAVEKSEEATLVEDQFKPSAPVTPSISPPAKPPPAVPPKRSESRPRPLLPPVVYKHLPPIPVSETESCSWSVDITTSNSTSTPSNSSNRKVLVKRTKGPHVKMPRHSVRFENRNAPIILK